MAALMPSSGFPGQATPSTTNQHWFSAHLSSMAWSSGHGIVRSCWVVILPPQLLWATLSYLGGGVGFGLGNLIGAPLVAGMFSVFFMVAFRFIYSVSWMPYLSRAEAIWNRVDLPHAAFLGVSCFASCTVIYTLLAFNEGPTEHHWVIMSYSCILAVSQCLVMIYYEETVIQFPQPLKEEETGVAAYTKVKEQIEVGLNRGVPSGLLAFFLIVFLTCLPQSAETQYFCVGYTTVGWLDRLWLHLGYAGIVATMMWSVARRVFVANHSSLGFRLAVRDGYVNSPNLPELISSMEMVQQPLLKYLAHQQLSEIATNPKWAETLREIFSPRVLPSQRDTSALVRAVRICNGVIRGQAEFIDKELTGMTKGAVQGQPPTIQAPMPQAADPNLKTLFLITWDHFVLPLASWRIEIGKWVLGERYNVQPRSFQHTVFPSTERPRQAPLSFGAPATNGHSPLGSTNPNNRMLHRPGGVMAFNAMVGNSQSQNVTVRFDHGETWWHLLTWGFIQGLGMGLRTEASIKQTPREYLSSYLTYHRKKVVNILKGLKMFSMVFVEQREYRVRLVLADWQMVYWSIIGVACLVAYAPPDKQFGLPQATVESLETCILSIKRQLDSGDRHFVETYHGADLLTQLLNGLSLILDYNGTVTVDPKVMAILEAHRGATRADTPARDRTSLSRSRSPSPSRRSATPARQSRSPTPA